MVRIFTTSEIEKRSAILNDKGWADWQEQKWIMVEEDGQE